MHTVKAYRSADGELFVKNLLIKS